MRYEDKRERKCPICGKTYIKAFENIYKTRKGTSWEHYCSYTCYNKALRKIEEDKKND